MTDITQTELKALLSYDPETGAFTWRRRPSNRIAVGLRAGTIDTQGYVRIIIRHTQYPAHRLAFLYMAGAAPSIVDHINGIRTDNRFCNLREATALINSINRRKPANNTSGFKGVSFFKATGRWQASIRVNSKRIHLGFFGTAEEASGAYEAAATEYFGQFARGE